MYLDRASSLHGEETKVFVSLIKPHKAVTLSTIARWIRTTLELSGTDAFVFGAHSVHEASASTAVRGGIHVTEDILKAANWTSGQSFRDFTTNKWIMRSMVKPLSTTIAQNSFQNG